MRITVSEPPAAPGGEWSSRRWRPATTGRGGVRARAAGARAHHDLRRRTTSIVRATAAEGARRLVVVTANGMITEGDGSVTRLVFKPVLGRVPHNPFADMLRMEDVVRASGLDWTSVRPPPLTEGPRTGSYRSAIDRNVRGGLRVSRADLADCVLRRLDEQGSLHAALAIGG